jgi:superfamily II DNA/RNA helicase
MMLSATLSPALEGLRRVVLHAPAIVKLEEGPGGEAGGLTQFFLRTPGEDKFLALLSLFRLRLIGGRTLVFTNALDTCYRLKQLLDKFGIPSATLNAELPVRSRASVIEQFNRGLFDILIATDEALGGEEEEAAPVQQAAPLAETLVWPKLLHRPPARADAAAPLPPRISRAGPAWNGKPYGQADAAAVRGWLEERGLGRYAPLFHANEIDFETLPFLTLQDLRDLPIHAVGPRRKLLAALERM